MKHILFGITASTVKIAILIKDSCFNKNNLLDNYILPTNIPIDQFIGLNLEYQPYNKCTAVFAKAYLNELLPVIDSLLINTLLIADPLYFKYLTKNTKAEPFYGYVCDVAIVPYTHIKVILVPNYQAMQYNPLNQSKITLGLEVLKKYMKNTYIPPGTGIIHSEYYPETIQEITTALKTLNQYKKLTCDIETRSLEFWNAGISTISFAWNQHKGIAFAINRGDNPDTIKSLLKTFLKKYTGALIYHNAGYDIKVLVYELWMKHLADYPNMLKGINCLTNKFEDTKPIAFLSTNNAIENKLSLKYLAQEFAGNYAQADIGDTDNILLPDLLRYNLTDALSTWYVYNKHVGIMLDDQQEDIYFNLFKSTIKILLQTELCGMPISPVKVQQAKKQLSAIVDAHNAILNNSPIIKSFHHDQLIQKAIDKTETAKKKVYTITDSVIACDFNPNSGPQLQALIYDYLGYAVIDRTDTKLPATGVKTLKKLIHHATCPEHKQIFKSLIRLNQANKILTTFIPAFENAQQLPDKSWRLYGNFNLGGTKSGRLSSSNPNLTNIPSHSIFAKIIKECFVSPKGWVFAGADFNSLEAMISALTTKDINKLKVYEEGYDSHSFNAYAYYKEQMPDIVDTLESINSIAIKYPDLRQSSKPITFLLTYGGTYRGLMANIGLSEVEAKDIEQKYHKLYAISDKWVKDQLKVAKSTGYVVGAFGLKLRTPLIKSTTGYSAISEGRTAGNMLGQSYGLLNTRAANAFMERVYKSQYCFDILPACQIHDSIYIMFKNSAKVATWINDNLIDCMAWQNLPELQHPVVKLGANLELYWPHWNNKITIPNHALNQKIKAICRTKQKEKSI